MLRPLLLLLVPPTTLLAQATVEGRVALPAARTAPVATKRYEIISKGGVLATNPPLGVVYLEGDFAKSKPTAVPRLDQKDLTFIPALLPVQVGTRVEFPNLDDTFHNIFSFSPAKRFDLGRYRPEERPIPSQVFDKAGLVTLRCDIHEHMRALILVVDTPYFVLTDPRGRFQLKNLPPGKWQLRAWTSSKSTQSQPVELRAATVTRVEFP